MDYDAKALGGLLDGANPFFCDKPPPGALTASVQESCPAAQISPDTTASFDMTFPKGPGMGGMG